eukprot:15237552-Ditylum_brightwellii.AAC.1
MTIGNICGTGNHVTTKNNLAWCGKKCGVIGGAEGKSDALEYLVHFFGSMGSGTTVQVISTKVFGND